MSYNTIDDLPQKYQSQVRAKLSGQPLQHVRIAGQKDGEAVVESAETAPDVLEMTAPEDQQKRRRNKQIEMAEQTAYFNQIDIAVREGKPGANCIFGIPNGTTANPMIGKMMVRSGVRKGVPDLAIMVPRQDFHGAFVEMKKPCGVLSDVGPEQKEWIERLNDAGYKAVICFGFREALAFTKSYLGWSD